MTMRREGRGLERKETPVEGRWGGMWKWRKPTVASICLLVHTEDVLWLAQKHRIIALSHCFIAYLVH